jgi:hypothetical protein
MPGVQSPARIPGDSDSGSAGADGLGADRRFAVPSVLPRGGDTRPTFAGWLVRHPAWPVTALLAGYPLWWALGIADFMWILVAIPMTATMLAWRTGRSRPLRLPPGFGIWAVFLVWTILSVVMIGMKAPGTVTSPVSHRLVAYTDRTVTYVAITVLLLYVGNLTHAELPRRKLAGLIGLLAIYATMFGIAGIFLKNFQFSSPILHLVPHSLAHNNFFQAQFHPALNQVQYVFGTATGQGRPKAPFDYTNTWGECLTITLPWLLLVCFGAPRRRWLRVLGWATLFFAVVALVYSLNRGAWIATAFSVLYLAVRLAARGRLAMLSAIVAGLALLVIVLVVSPLSSVITQRLQHGQSNVIRSSLFSLSLTDGLASPILGYGDTRQQAGSPLTIAVGPTPGCPTCGQAEVGSTGQFSLLLICSGFVGVLLYCGFFAYGALRYWRDPTPEGIAGVLVIVLSFIYLFTYDAVAAPLGITMLAYAIMWRNEMHRRAAAGPQPDQIPRPRRFAIRATDAALMTPQATASAR